MTITDANYGYQTNPVMTDKPDTFALRFRDPFGTDETFHTQIPNVSEVLRIAHSPDLDHPVGTTDFLTNLTNDVHCNHISLMISNLGFTYRYDSNGILAWQ